MNSGYCSTLLPLESRNPIIFVVLLTLPTCHFILSPTHFPLPLTHSSHPPTHSLLPPTRSSHPSTHSPHPPTHSPLTPTHSPHPPTHPHFLLPNPHFPLLYPSPGNRCERREKFFERLGQIHRNLVMKRKNAFECGERWVKQLSSKTLNTHDNNKNQNYK